MHCLVLLAVDGVLIIVATVAAILLCAPDVAFAAVVHGAPHLAITLAATLPVLLLAGLNRTFWRFTSLNDAVRIALATFAIVALAACADFAFERLAGVPRLVPMMQALLMLFLLVGARFTMRIRYQHRRRARQTKMVSDIVRENVLLIGLNPIADLFLACLSQNGYGRVDVVGILSDADRHRGRFLRSRKILGPPEALDDVLHDLSIHGVTVDRIVLATSLQHLSPNASRALRNIEAERRIRIECLSERFGLTDDASPHGSISGSHFTAARAGKTSASGGLKEPNEYLLWKRLLDVAVALACTVCFAPAMLLVFIIVRFDVGAPAIFWQQRPGAEGRPFRVLKFRTMRTARGPDDRLLTDAERVSGIGRVLRRLRLDELPQVFNILLGHMSLVGPRPLLPVDQPSVPTDRLKMRPGLTGWAQINGGRHLSIADKVALDLWYIKNASFRLDMVILAHTARTILFGEKIDHRAIREAWKVIQNNDQVVLSDTVGA